MPCLIARGAGNAEHDGLWLAWCGIGKVACEIAWFEPSGENVGMNS